MVHILPDWNTFQGFLNVKFIDIEGFNVMLPLLKVLPVDNLIFESVSNGIGQLDENLAFFGNYNNVTARFEDSEQGQVYQDLVQ